MLRSSEIIVDNFAGGGGASHGLWMAFGQSPAVAVNHNPAAIRVHTANHPDTEHYIENVWAVDPMEATAGRPVGAAWFSPDCTHFSRAKGGKPKSAKIRALAWVVHRWAKAVRPRVIFVENVEEFLTWGPLGPDGQPVEAKAGTTFKRWFGRMTKGLGYRGAWKVMRACDYGAPTTRTRIFFVFRCDGLDPVFPEPTHGPGLLPYRTAAECIDFDRPCPSIFMTADEVKEAGLKIRRPLADATLARIARGFQRHVVEELEAGRQPFIVEGQDLARGSGSFAPLLVQTGYGERKDKPGCKAQKTRVLDIRQPLGSVVACGVKHAVACAYLVKNNGGHEGHGQGLDEPMAAVTTRDSKSMVVMRAVRAEDLTEAQREGAVRVYAFLTKYNGTQQYPRLAQPMPTVLTTDCLALVNVVCLRLADGDYVVVDIGMRMLTPRELARAQGFPDDYDIDLGGTLTNEEQVRLIGNSVCPILAKLLAEANFAPDLALKSRHRKGTHLDLAVRLEGGDSSSRQLN
jgi:DNA (cytosine-5)-methyltransferase 1